MAGLELRGSLGLCLALLSSALLSANDAWLHFRGEPEYEAARAGEILAGRAPSLLFPLFGAELPEGEAELGREAAPRRGLGLSLSTPSFWYDSPFPSSGAISSPPVPKLPELQAAIDSFPQLFELDLEWELGDSLSARTDLEISYRRDWLAGEGSSLTWESEDWTTGLLGATDFPRKAWLSYGRPGLGLALGRFPSGIGAGRFGSTLLNPVALSYDQARLHLGTEKLRLLWMLGTSSAQLSAAEAEVQWRRVTQNDIDVSGGAIPQSALGTSYWDWLDDHDASDSRTALKLFAYHLLEWAPWDFLRLGIGETSTMGGTVPSLNFLLPSLLWHNTYQAGYANVAVAGLFSLTLFPGLLLSGEFLIDDARAGDDPDYSKPSALAWQASASYSLRPAPGGILSLGLEASHADRWTYVRWQPYQSPYQRQILPGGSRGIDYPLGSTYGPDSDHFGLWAAYRAPGGARLALSWELLRKGPIYMGMIDANGIPVYFDYDSYAERSGSLAAILSKPDELRRILKLEGSLPLGRGLAARLSLTLGDYRNYGHVAGKAEDLGVLYAGLLWSPIR